MSNTLKITICSIFFVFVCALFSPFGFAQIEERKRNFKHYDELGLSVGFGFFSSPEYEGSSKTILRAGPFLDIKYKKVSFNLISGFSYDHEISQNLFLGVGVKPYFGRSNNASELAGLPKIDPSLEAYVFSKVQIYPFIFRGEIAGDLLSSGHKGEFAKVSLSTGFPLSSSNTFIRPSFGVTFGSENYLNELFGITAEQAVLSAHPEYMLKPSIKDFSANVIVIHKLNDRVSLSFNLGYTRLGANVADSPLVLKRDQSSYGLYLAYQY